MANKKPRLWPARKGKIAFAHMSDDHLDNSLRWVWRNRSWVFKNHEHAAMFSGLLHEAVNRRAREGDADKWWSKRKVARIPAPLGHEEMRDRVLRAEWWDILPF